MALLYQNIARTGLARVGFTRVAAWEIALDPDMTAIVSAGSPSFTIDYVVVASGAGTFAGTADNAVPQFIGQATGSGTFLGTALADDVDYAVDADPAGGEPIFVGSAPVEVANVYEYVASGQVGLSGATVADDVDVMVNDAGGVATFAGDASDGEIDFPYTASGGADFGATSWAFELEYTPEAGGALVHGGSGDNAVLDIIGASNGQLDTSGSSAADDELAVVTASGGVATFAGDASLAALDFTGTSGGQVDTDGDGDFLIEYAPDASGLETLTGVGEFQAGYAPDDIGGFATFAGDSVFSPSYLLDASGLATFSGDVTTDEVNYLFVASGVLTVSGIAGPLEANFVSGIVVTSITMGGETDVLFSIDKKGLPVFLRKFDGDIKLSLSLDGGVVTIWAGQPQMDGGLETAVNISLFTESGWWGNSIIGTGHEVGSDFEEAIRQPLTNKARLDIIEAARAALQWMLDTGIAESIDYTATIPAVGRLDFAIRIKQPEKTPENFRYNVNWANQEIIMKEAAA